MTENNIEVENQEWPFWLKASVVAGAGMIAAEAAFIWTQAVYKLDASMLDNISGGAIALAGCWRIVEPFWLMKIKKSENTIY